MFESVRLFALCEGMNWCHLPVAGGIYDQHPQLLDEWLVIFHRRAQHEEKKRKQETAQAQRNAKKGRR